MQIKTKKYGVAEIIGDGSKYGYLKVKFLNTGHIDEFRKDAIFKGEIRDKYAASFLGVGIIGNIKTRGKYKPYYTVWRNLIYRCYSGASKAYSNVIVCERWKTFEFFYEDIPLIEGWDIDKFLSHQLTLDKDLKQPYCPQKIYSLETCCWLSKAENYSVQDAQQKWFEAIGPNGERAFSRNITAFAREHNLERKQISAVLHKKFKSTLGWKFKYVDMK